MSIFLNSDSKIIVQGITGGEGSKHTARMLAAGSNVVGGGAPVVGEIRRGLGRTRRSTASPAVVEAAS